MSEYLEIAVTDQNDNERHVIVTDWTYKAGHGAWSSAGEHMDNPPEGETLEDVVCEWSDTKKPLTADEWEHCGVHIEDEIFDYIHNDGPDEN